MAFNPFHRFRKHQKVVFAGLILMCMFVFILSIGSGRSDPITQLMERFGAGRQRGQLVTTLYGSKYYESDLERLSRRRQAADEFLRFAMQQAAQTTVDEVEKQQKEAKPEGRDLVLTEVLNNLRNRRPDMTDRARCNQIQTELVMLANARKSKPEQAATYDAVAAALRYQYWALNPERPRTAFYFGGSRGPDALLDFAVWRKQADRLGIVLTSSDVCKAVNQEVGRPDFLPRPIRSRTTPGHGRSCASTGGWARRS